MPWYLLNVTKKACVKKLEKGFDPEKDGAKLVPKDEDVYVYTKGDDESQIFECPLVNGKRKCVESNGTIKLKKGVVKLTEEVRYKMILTPLEKRTYDWKCDHPVRGKACEISVAKQGDLCKKHSKVKRVFPVLREVFHDFSPFCTFIGTYSTLAKARKAALEYTISLMKDGYKGWEVGMNEEGDNLEGYRNIHLAEYIAIYQEDVK